MNPEQPELQPIVEDDSQDEGDEPSGLEIKQLHDDETVNLVMEIIEVPEKLSKGEEEVFVNEELAAPAEAERKEEQTGEEQQPETARFEIPLDRALVMYRTLGKLTGTVPGVLASRNLYYAVGNTLQAINMRLHIFIATHLPGEIRAVSASASRGSLILAAAVGSTVYVLNNALNLRHSYEHSALGRVTHLISCGVVVASIGTDNTLTTFHVPRNETLRNIVLPHGLTVTCHCIPHGYANKLLLGTRQGALLLYNVRMGTLLYRFELGAEVTALTACSLQHIVAVGLANGEIRILHLLYGQSIVTYSQGKHPITALAFRRDGAVEQLASGNTEGEVAVWDMAEKRLAFLLARTTSSVTGNDVYEPAHRQGILNLFWVPREPMLITSGKDNAVAHYVLDGALGAPRLLRRREGHSKPCTVAHFFDDDWVLSASEDGTLRKNHVAADPLSMEFGQKGIAAKARKQKLSYEEVRLPPVVAIASSVARMRNWTSCLTCHRGEPGAHSWRVDETRLEDHTLLPSRDIAEKRADPTWKRQQTCVAISHCGNFGFVGTEDGTVHVHQLQSKRFLHYCNDPTIPGDKTAHDGPVTNIHTAPCVVISCGLDGFVRQWDLKGTLLRRLWTGHGLLTSSFSIFSGLLAVGCDDHVCRVYDVELSRQTVDILEQDKPLQAVRRFEGHTDTVTSVAFSPDTRVLFTASKDKTLRVFHMATSRTIDTLVMSSAVLSISVHPRGQLVALVRENDVGVTLWVNMLQYGYGPACAAETEVKQGALVAARQGLVEFSPVSPVVWASLPFVDQIQLRNRASTDVTAEAAEPTPFFFGLNPTEDVVEKAKGAKKAAEQVAPVATTIKKGKVPVFVRLCVEKKYDEAEKHLIALDSAAKIEQEFRTSVCEDHALALLGFFLHKLGASKRNFELLQACCTVYLKYHGVSLSNCKAAQGRLAQLAELQESRWGEVRDLVDHTLCLVRVLSGQQW